MSRDSPISAMNRSGRTDSNKSLDPIRSQRQNRAMNQQFNLYLERVEAAESRHRFYVLSIEQTLFGEPVLVRRWGRIGTRGRIRLQTCESEMDAIRLFAEHLKRRRSRAYLVRPADRGGQGAEPSPQFRSW